MQLQATTNNLRILPFLQHYSAYKAWEQLETAFDQLARLMHPDNNLYLFNSPWQKLVEDALQRAEPDLWEWYQWWLLEAAEGQEGWEFDLEDEAGGTKTYDTTSLTLQEFLTIIAEHYD